MIPPFWFSMRQGKVHDTESRDVRRLTAPNLPEWFIEVKQVDGVYRAALRQAVDGPEVAVNQLTVANPMDAWYAAFELYRNHVVNEAALAMAHPKTTALVGCLLGTAVGDALGLPSEGLSRKRLARYHPHVDRHRFVLGRGMISDDTEHACLLAQAFIRSGHDRDRFLRSLGWRLRGWFLGLPSACGWGTARACFKLCLGASPESSGVASAGNGAAMRSPVLGVAIGQDWDTLRAWVRAATRVTHVDARAEHGAFAVAVAAAMASRESFDEVSPREFATTLRRALAGEADELLQLVEAAVDSVLAEEDTASFALALGQGNGVSGFVHHTVPVVLHAWLRHPADFRQAVLEVIRLGGDTDTTAAIVGALVGARVGKVGIPVAWLDGIADWPRSVGWIERVGERMGEACVGRDPLRPIPLAWYGVLPRNLLFLAIVLAHGFRRLLPPYG